MLRHRPDYQSFKKRRYFINSSSRDCNCLPGRLRATITPSGEIRKFDGMKRMPYIAAAGLCLPQPEDSTFVHGRSFSARNRCQRAASWSIDTA